MKIVIVEDEPRIREGIAMLLGRLGPEYQVVASAENGKIGLEKILQTRPDLIITDVKMPEMDGVQMLTTLRQQGVQTQAIVLSAYSDFSYAQKTMKLGVKDYLLKPIDRESFLEALKEAGTQFARQQNTRTVLEQSLTGILRQAVTHPEQLTPELLEALQGRFAINPHSPLGAVAVFGGSNFEKEMKSIKQFLPRITEGWQEGKPVFLLIPEKRAALCMVFDCPDLDKFYSWVQIRLRKLGSSPGTPAVTFGWLTAENLWQVHGQFLSLLEYQDFPISQPDCGLIESWRVGCVAQQDFPATAQLQKQMRSAITALDWQQIADAYGQFSAILRENRVYRAKSVKDAYVGMLWCVLNSGKDAQVPGMEAFHYPELLGQTLHANNRQDLAKGIEAILQVLKARTQTGERELSPMIRRADMIIREEYKQGLTLDELAERLRVTPEYLSAQFHREMGVTFGTYIRDIRMEQAKKLLLGTEKKLYEIAQEVGYADPKYFSRVFREQTGLLPADYRKLHK